MIARSYRSRAPDRSWRKSGGGAVRKARGEVRWFVDDVNNVIVNSTSFASVPTPPGHTAVLKSVVDAACSCASRGRGTVGRHGLHVDHRAERAMATPAGQLQAMARRLHQHLFSQRRHGIDDRRGVLAFKFTLGSRTT